MSRPTMEDVAARAGVSRSLVSLVMRESPNVSEARRRAVLEAAAALGYRPDLNARNLASRRTRTVGVLLDDLHNPFFAEAVDGIEAAARSAGYRLLLASGQVIPAREREAMAFFLDLRADGIILLGPRVDAGAITRVARSVPVVVVGKPHRSRSVDSVRADEHLGAALAVDHLATLGHRRIAHIDGGRGAGAVGRRQGYEAAMSRNGLENEIRVVRGDFTERSGVHGIEALLDEDRLPTAVFTANDLMAVGALDRIEAEGFRVPDDVSLVGYDNTMLAGLRHVSLTTIDQPRAELGGLAMGALLERLDHDRTVPVRHVVTPTLVVRATTGPPRGGS